MKIPTRALTALALVSTTAAAAAPVNLEIKGFALGMQTWQVKAHESDFCFASQCAFSKKTPFTVGGVKGKVVGATYDGNAALDSIEFSFDSFGFQGLRNAMEQKYPATKCVESSVITRLGIQAPQVVCRFETEQGGIYLIRAAGNINRSMMLMLSSERKHEIVSRIDAATKDL